MEKIILEKDIPVFYITAKAFPEGVIEAFDKLHRIVPEKSRMFYGISRPENNGPIVYKAAAEELHSGEAKESGCESMIIQKGSYVCETIMNYEKDVEQIGRTFQTLLQQPGLDPKGYCVESYFNDTDVKCLIRLQE